MKTIFSKKNEQLALTAKLDDDKLKLFIDVEPIECKALSKEDFLKLIHEFSGKADLHEGVLEDVLKTLHKGEKVSERRIAKGTPAQTGADGKLLLLVKKFSGKGSASVDSKGFADFKELHLFDNILTEQAVARLYPPKAGVDGLDALGEPIKAAPGKPFKLTIDKSLKLEAVTGEDYQHVIAQIDGYLEEDNGRMAVHSELVIKGDLDLHTGNLNFIGSIKVMGSVVAGLTVQARRGIEVNGDARAATFICPEGDIKIKGFYFGGESGKVTAGKSFQASLVQEISVEAQGDIRIEKESLDSVLRTQAGLFLSTGRFVGGQAFAVCGAEALQWGNDAGKKTEIFLCSDVEVRGDFSKLVRLLADHEKAIELIKVHMGPFAANPGRIQNLNVPLREKMEKFHRKLKELEAARVKLVTQKEEMLQKAKSNHVPRVNVLGILYPGTRVRLGDKLFEPIEEIKGPKSIEYIVEQESFFETDLKGIQCDIDGDGSAVTEGEKKDEPGKKPTGK